MATLRNEPISAWSDGDSVEGFALLNRIERRQDKNGNVFLDLELADASTTIAGKVWSGSRALEREFEAFDFVAFKGSVKNYRDRLQISLSDCRRVEETDRGRGFDEAKLIPSSHEDLDDLMLRLGKALEAVERPPLAKLARETLGIHGGMLREHPAAKYIHHAYRDGLLEHMVSMIELAGAVCDHYRELDRDLVLIGVLFHDLGKMIEIGAMPANDYTLAGRLVGHVVIGRDMLMERCSAIDDFPADLQLQLEHLILSHQGRLDYGSPVEPKTIEAIALHFIDDLDSKLAQLRRAREGGEGLQFIRGLGRYVYFPESPASQSDADPAAESVASGKTLFEL